MHNLLSPLLLAVSVITVPHHASSLRIGEPLPCMRGELMTGETGTLPALADGRCTLLVIGFATDARIFAQAWSSRFRAAWRQNSQVTLYQIPVLGGVKARLAKGIIERRIRECTPAPLLTNVMTVWGALDEWKARVDYRAAEDAYLVLLDRDGLVAWRHAGPCEEAAWTALDRVMSRILNRGAAGFLESPVSGLVTVDSIASGRTLPAFPIWPERSPTAADWPAVSTRTNPVPGQPPSH